MTDMRDASDQLGLAKAIARVAHWEQRDKAGAPYIGHPMRVAAIVSASGGVKHEVVAALLHDVTEDSAIDALTLLGLGVSGKAVDIVDLLDRKKARRERRDYYTSIREHEGALAVKLADIQDNTDERRLALLEPDEADRLRNKYARALRELGA